jgi:hypothetical protein
MNNIAIQTLKGLGLRHRKPGLPFYRGGVRVNLKRGSEYPEQGGKCSWLSQDKKKGDNSGGRLFFKEMVLWDFGRL